MVITVNVKDGDTRLGLDIELYDPANLAKALAEAAVILSRGLEARAAPKAPDDLAFIPIALDL